MSRQNPTPGPWRVANNSMIETETGVPIAYMDRTPSIGTVPCGRNANAYLIAAAPDLLAALKRAFNLIKESGFKSGLIEDEFDATLKQAGEALAKADLYNAS